MNAARLRALATAAALGTAALALAASSSTTNEATKVGGNASGSTSAPSAGSGSASTDKYKVGDEVKLGDWTVSADSIVDPFTPTSQFSTPAKGRYVAVETTVKNLSSKPETVSSVMCFELRDSTGRQFSLDIMAGGGDSRPPDGEVDANGQLRGTLIYDVPADATGLTLRFKCDLLSTGSATIALS